MGPPHGHQVHHAAALDQDEILAEQVRGHIRDARLGEQFQHAQLRVGQRGELVLIEVDGRLRVADRGGDVTHLRPPGAGPAGPGGQGHGVLDQRERGLLCSPGIQDTGKREDLPERGGHRLSL
jgi:hypothetical protein